MLAAWKNLKNPVKIIILVILAFTLCCCFLLIVGSLSNSSETSITDQPMDVAEAPAKAEEKPTDAPTNTPEPTQTPAPTPSIDISTHIRTLDARLFSMREALDDLAVVELEYTNNPALLDDNDWYFRSTNILFRLQTGPKELSEMQSGNESLAQLETLLDEFAEITNEMAMAYIQGIDTKDTALIKTASDRLPIIEEKLSEIMDELNKRK